MDRRSPLLPAALAAAVGLATFISYLLTQSPGLSYTDSGELAAACATLGVAHPTGYPLFTLLGHTWTLLPWSSVIGGLNVLAAVFVSASVSMLFFVMLEFRVSRYVAMSVALLYGWTSIVWTQALSIEVYSLHALLLTITLFAALRSRNAAKNDVRWFAITALFFGLMLTNHLSSAFLAPGIVVLALPPGTTRAQWKRLALISCVGLIPLALYAYLPLRSAQDPPVNWGMVHRSFDAFLYHVKGTQFGVWLFSDDKVAGKNLKVFLAMLPQAVAWIGLVAVAVGSVTLVRRERRTALALALILSGNLGIALGYSIPDIENYFLPSVTVVVVCCGVGFHVLLQRFNAERFALALLLLPFVSATSAWKEQNRSKDRAVEAYTRLILDNAAPNAVIITHQWDFFCSAFWYLQTVEHLRPDVTIIDKELLRRTWYVPYLSYRYPTAMAGAQPAAAAYAPYLQLFEDNSDEFMKNRSSVMAIQQRFVALLNAIVETNDGKRPVYITGEMVNEEQGFATDHRMVPAGPLIRLVRDSVAMPPFNLSHVSEIAVSLQGHEQRLDKGLREIVVVSLAQAARYAWQVEHNASAFKQLREAVRTIDPRSIAIRQLDEVHIDIP
ncbi:hypothetical protein BH10BAC6_BH10BAC6_05130 [soil metagenome]